jgi:uncharacterized membrane protein YdjX (TVP38/TMEM64 family)
MNKRPFYLQVLLFLICFVPLALYMVGGLETEDGRSLLVIVLLGGVVSTIRALYTRNKRLKQAMAGQKQDELD